MEAAQLQDLNDPMVPSDANDMIDKEIGRDQDINS
jgi:hypothetical protein